jgi:urea transport system ATP-binding protein
MSAELEVRSVTLQYGAAVALRNVSISAAAGAVTCLMGRNGVGKTSLLRAIMGAHPITEGEIQWEGTDISRLPIYQRARCGIAWVPQGRDIFPLLTVEENLETGFSVLPPGQRRVPDEIFALFPNLKIMLRRRGGDLSGGQQQQLAIARALATDPKVLLLDEPCEGIQPSIVEEIEKVILRINREHGIAIVLVEQNVDFARRAADWFVIVEKGRIAASGKPQELTDELVHRHLAV